jgi:hypothetical protein
MYEGLVRNIEYVSKAQSVYEEALQSAVQGGIGWWRVNTQYCSDDSFDQEIIIEPIKNQLGVYQDPDIKQKDGSDAKFGFVFEDIPTKEAKRAHPDVNFAPSSGIALDGPGTWIKLDYTRVAEYYRIQETDDELIYMEDQEGHGATFFRSDVPKQYRKQIETQGETSESFRTRKVKRRKLQWFKIIGDTIVDRRDFKYKYIPLVRTIGIEIVIDGELHRRGHVRTLKDPQRMYNYNSSAQCEYGATGTKSPWVGPKAAFEGNESQWNVANIQNAAYLTYNHVDGDNNPIPKPERMDPPGLAPAFIEGMRIADHEMDMASGQYSAQHGDQSNERTGRAIAERQRQSDTATYHFVNNQALAIRYTGVIILDMAPHVYDTERVLQIMGRDGVQSNITIKPDMEEAVREEAQDKEIINIMFNPKIGKYIVEADIGPAYSTQRQEAWNAFVQIITGAPQLIDEIGDLMFRSADFPLADKIAERLMRKIRTEKPYLFENDAPTPQMQAMQQQVQELSQEVSGLLQKLAENRLKLVGKDQMRDIEAYDAETKRITATTNAQLDISRLQDPELLAGLKEIIMQTIQEARDGDITQSIARQQAAEGNPAAAGAPSPASQPPVDGAQQAGDGNWYVPDPRRPGKSMMVMSQ